MEAPAQADCGAGAGWGGAGGRGERKRDDEEEGEGQQQLMIAETRPGAFVCCGLGFSYKEYSHMIVGFRNEWMWERTGGGGRLKGISRLMCLAAAEHASPPLKTKKNTARISNSDGLRLNLSLYLSI